MEGLDFNNFPQFGSSFNESYNPSRYSDRFQHEDFSRMNKEELEKSKKKIKDQIKVLEKEQEERIAYHKKSYIIDERIDYEYKLLDTIEEYLEALKEEKKKEN